MVFKENWSKNLPRELIQINDRKVERNEAKNFRKRNKIIKNEK